MREGRIWGEGEIENAAWQSSEIEYGPSEAWDQWTTLWIGTRRLNTECNNRDSYRTHCKIPSHEVALDQQTLPGLTSNGTARPNF